MLGGNLADIQIYHISLEDHIANLNSLWLSQVGAFQLLNIVTLQA
jgi:hypothetical protein